MKINQDKLMAANTATVESLLAAASTALTSAERIARLNVETARKALADASSNTHALLSAQDAQQFAAIQSSLVQPTLENAVEYSRAFIEISHAAQQEFARMFEVQLAEFQNSATRILENSASVAPSGTEGAYAALQAAIDSARNTFNSLTAASQAAKPAAKASTSRAKRSTKSAS